MGNTIEVQTSIGTFELIKPKAGVRNRAMIKAETDSGGIKRVVFMTELLPNVINKRPEGVDKDTRIEHLLDSLEIEDYDLLVEGADKLVYTEKDEKTIDKKKMPSVDSSTKV